MIAHPLPDGRGRCDLVLSRAREQAVAGAKSKGVVFSTQLPCWQGCWHATFSPLFATGRKRRGALFLTRLVLARGFAVGRRPAPRSASGKITRSRDEGPLVSSFFQPGCCPVAPHLSQKQGQRLPMPQQVARRLTQTRVGISFPPGKLRLERSRQGDGMDTDNTELNSPREKVPDAVSKFPTLWAPDSSRKCTSGSPQRTRPPWHQGYRRSFLWISQKGHPVACGGVAVAFRRLASISTLPR